MSESITGLHRKLMEYSNRERYILERKEIYDKVMRLKPENADEWAKTGFIYNQIGHPKKAVSCFEEALRLEPGNITFLQDISSILFENSRFEQTIPHLESIAELLPRRASNWSLLAFCLYKIGHYAKAESLFEKALELDEEDPTIIFDVGMFYKNQGQHKRALDYLKKASRLKPKDDFVWFMLGHSYQQLQMSDKAIEAYETAVDVNPRNDSVWNNLGLEHVRQQRYRKGIECYKRAIQNNDKNETTWSNLKFAYYGTEEYEKRVIAKRKRKNWLSWTS